MTDHPDGSLWVGLATSEAEILEAQKLRWSVFAGELGARLPSREPGVDRDLFDPFCRHLIVRDERNGQIAGTYRILTPEAAAEVGGYYTEGEFDLTRLMHLREKIVEIGRSCVHVDYRASAAVIGLLWSGIARFMSDGGYEYLIGCASISMADGGHNAAGVYKRLAARYLSPPEYRVTPRTPLPLDGVAPAESPAIPPLLKGYLRAGAWICGEPCWDPDFNAADLMILLHLNKVDSRYSRHFLERAS